MKKPFQNKTDLKISKNYNWARWSGLGLLRQWPQSLGKTYFQLFQRLRANVANGGTQSADVGLGNTTGHRNTTRKIRLWTGSGLKRFNPASGNSCQPSGGETLASGGHSKGLTGALD